MMVNKHPTRCLQPGSNGFHEWGLGRPTKEGEPGDRFEMCLASGCCCGRYTENGKTVKMVGDFYWSR